MKKTEVYNNLPKEVLDRHKLPKGTKAIYRLRGIKPDPDNPGRFLIPFQVNVPPQGRVAVKVGKEEEVEYFDIAAIQTVLPNKKVKMYDILFTKQNAGVIEIDGGTTLADQLYPYLEMSDYNESNEQRDRSVSAIYYRVDHEKEAINNRKRRNKMKEALDVAYGFKDNEVIEFADANGFDSRKKISELRDEIEAYAEKNPVEFLEKSANKQNAIKATIKRALSKGVIEFDKPDSKFVWGKSKETICTVARTAGSDHIQGLTDFLVTSKNGSVILDEITKLTK